MHTLPAGVAPHVDFVTPTVVFPPTSTAVASPPVKEEEPSAAFGDVTPAFLKKLYNITDMGKGADVKNIQAIASFIGQYFNQEDLATFRSK